MYVRGGNNERAAHDCETYRIDQRCQQTRVKCSGSQRRRNHLAQGGPDDALKTLDGAKRKKVSSHISRWMHSPCVPIIVALHVFNPHESKAVNTMGEV
jgi:hypothetical protein